MKIPKKFIEPELCNVVLKDHYHGTTHYNNIEVRRYTNILTTDSNGRIIINLTKNGLSDGEPLFSSILTAQAIAMDNSNNAPQGPYPILQTITPTQVTFRLIRGTTTGVLIGGTVISSQFVGSGYTVYIDIIGVST